MSSMNIEKTKTIFFYFNYVLLLHFKQKTKKKLLFNYSRWPTNILEERNLFTVANEYTRGKKLFTVDNEYTRENRLLNLFCTF